MSAYLMTELEKIAKCYNEFGVTLPMLLAIAENAPHNLPEEALLIGIRMTLANEYNAFEAFHTEQIAACLGESADYIRQQIKARGAPTAHTTPPARRRKPS